MIQDTRKDPRAKVLSMTVRYKSATLDEFIEHHSHDVSRGGMFIKTPAPFPPGTLLKFEVRISDEKKVMQGVGRVVWKRETASSTGPETPAGMGVKFIKLDDDSKRVIDRLVSSRGERDGAFDHGDKSAAKAGQGPAAQAAADRAIPVRKGTMIGLGAVTSPEPSKPPPPAAEKPFFPEGAPATQPAAEDQTVMRQAAELLREALREAGGSMDEVMGTSPVVNAIGDVSHGEAAKHPDPILDAAPAVAARSPDSKASSPAPMRADSKRPTPVAPGPASSRPPLSRPSSVPPPKKSSGSVWMLLGVAAIGGVVFFFAKRNKSADDAPAVSATAAAAPVPTPEPMVSAEPSAAESASAEALPSAQASAAEEASAAPSAAPETPAEKAARIKAEADAAKKAAADAKKAAAEEAKRAADEARQAAADARKAAAEQARKTAAAYAAAHPAPRPAAPKPAPATTDTGEAAPAPTAQKPPPTEDKSAAPAPSAKPAAPPAVEKPAPAKPADNSDNPY